MTLGRHINIDQTLRLTCLLLVALGVGLAASGEGFAPWRALMAAAVLDVEVFPSSLHGFARLCDGILGGSLSGKWLAIAWLVHEPLRRRERWAVYVLLSSLLGEAFIQAWVFALTGASLKLLLLHLVPSLFVGALALKLYPQTSPGASLGMPKRLAVRALLGGCLLTIGVGVLAALCIRSALFQPYNEGIATLYFGGQISAQGVLWERFAYGLIGATIVGHFIALLGILRFAWSQRWALYAVVSSMLAWFVIDSTRTLIEGAWFNLWLINLPSLLVILIPAWVWRGQRHDMGLDDD